MIEADLVAAAMSGKLRPFFDRQLAPGRAALVVDDAAEVEVRFKLADAAVGPDGQPEAFVVLREYRTDDAPNWPSMYWYGLVQQDGPDAYLYEAYHQHDEPLRASAPHFQQERRDRDGRILDYHQEHELAQRHVVPAVLRLLERYYEREVLRESTSDEQD